MVNKWGEMSAQEALLARLQSFMPVPSKGQSLVNYLGSGYPLFGNAGGRWNGIREMGFPLLVTKDRILTECYVRTVCPEGREDVATAALTSEAWKIPDDLHIRVWTPQPKKKGENPVHALPKTIQDFKDAGIHPLEFMNTVKTAENSVRFSDMSIDVSHAFFEEWTAIMRSGEPYLCFLPERKSPRIVEGLRWFRSVIGISSGGDNRKITEDDLQARRGTNSAGDTTSGVSAAPDAVWLWKVQEWARAEKSTIQSGVLNTGGWVDLKSALEYRLADAAKQARKIDKAQGEMVLTVGTHLLDMVREGDPFRVLEAMDVMQEDADMSWWWSKMNVLDERVRQYGMNVTF